MFFLDYEDPEEAERMWLKSVEDAGQALDKGVAIPVVSSMGEESYLIGAHYTAATVHITTNLNGITLRFPPLVETEAYERLVSWETMLPLLEERELSPKYLKQLAERFRGLAKLLDEVAEKP